MDDLGVLLFEAKSDIEYALIECANGNYLKASSYMSSAEFKVEKAKISITNNLDKQK